MRGWEIVCPKPIGCGSSSYALSSGRFGAKRWRGTRRIVSIVAGVISSCSRARAACDVVLVCSLLLFRCFLVSFFFDFVCFAGCLFVSFFFGLLLGRHVIWLLRGRSVCMGPVISLRE